MDRCQALSEAFLRVRAQSLALAEGLSAEDCQLQSMPDASPVKWHLAHSTWFFETFVLAAVDAAYQPVDPAYRELFNSYYVGIGARAPRAERGLMSRPSLDQVLAYRKTIDARLLAGLAEGSLDAEMLDRIELGLHHEQQHQELIVTDLKHHLSRNPLYPVYRAEAVQATESPLQWIAFEAGVQAVGHAGDDFAFDNEMPRHRVFAEPFALASRLVSNAEYQAFIDDGGYQRPELWLSDGWDARLAGGWQAPLYWFDDGSHYTLAGRQPRVVAAAVCHLSYYEADAFARWMDARLPTEAEWEIAAQSADSASALAQMIGERWQWTHSAYLPYPGFQPAAGAVGEYNGKFMINQMVLRGGSCATPGGHVRSSYRNFFPPAARWQFSGIRLARSV